MNDALLRRVSDALDAPGGLDADEELRALLEGDPSAQAYADDVGAIGEALSALGASLDVDRDWDALASAIDLRLAESSNVDDDGLDVTAPPRLTGPSGPESSQSAAELGASQSGPSEAQVSFEAAPAVRTVSPARASGAPETSARVVDLSERRRRRGLFAAIGGLSAAAAVGLGITFGLTTMSDPAAELAAAPAADVSQSEEAPMAAPADAPGVWAGAERMVEEAEDSEPELPAAAALNQWGSESSLGATEGARLPQRGGASLERARWEDRAAGSGTARSMGAVPSAEPPRPSRPAPAASPPPARYAAAEPASVAVGGRAQSARPSTGETDAALSSVTRAVQRCMPDHTVVARIAVTVRDGAVTAVRIPAPFAGHSSGACMERAVRAVPMPASVETYDAEFVYRPAPVAGSGPGPSAAPSSRARRAAPVRSHEVLDAFESAPR